MDGNVTILPHDHNHSYLTSDTLLPFKHHLLIHNSLQYYYAHAPKNFNTDGAEIFKGDGLIYGGEPVLLGQREVKKKEDAPMIAKKITKYSWIDESTKVKIYIELDQFKGSAITDAMVEVKFEEQGLNIKIVDESCQSHILNIPK